MQQNLGLKLKSSKLCKVRNFQKHVWTRLWTTEQIQFIVYLVSDKYAGVLNLAQVLKQSALWTRNTNIRYFANSANYKQDL